MQHYIGLDVSVKETSVCIVDKAGKVIREVKVATKPAAIKGQDHRALRQSGGRARQAIEIAAGLDHFLAAEIADDPLLGLAVLANGLDQIQIGVAISTRRMTGLT